MDSFFNRFRNSLVLIVVLLAQAIALAVQVPHVVPSQAFSTSSQTPAKPGRGSTLRYWAVALVTPFEKLAHGTGLQVRSVWHNYIDLRHTRQQNRDLQAEVARLREEQAAFAEDAREGRRIEALLDFRQHYIAKTVAAQIVGTSGTDRSRVVYLDKGSADGLKPDQAVITPDGVVGKLRAVLGHTAQLLLLSDTTSGAGVVLASSRIRGIVHGAANGKLEITNLTADSRIQPGEKVLTSGGDQVFPRGLPVGVVESIEPDPEHQPYTRITVKPAAELTRLEEVLVVTSLESTLTPEAQNDASIAEATAAAGKRAAELASERLPSVNDPNDPNAPKDLNAVPTPVGGVPGIPNSAAPKPLPALRPDRYSPGTTPRADQLTPGAAAPKNSAQPQQPQTEAPKL